MHVLFTLQRRSFLNNGGADHERSPEPLELAKNPKALHNMDISSHTLGMTIPSIGTILFVTSNTSKSYAGVP